MAMRSIEEWHRRFQHQARWTRQVRRFLAGQLQFKNARRILEVGCGTGAITPELREDSNAQIFGLDIRLDSLRLAQSVDPLTRFTAGDALNLPYAGAVFDGVVCHFLLLWLPDPVQALVEMARVTQPGGFIAALAEPDYGGRIDHPSPLEKLGRWQAEALHSQGADPNLGRKLPGLLRQAGLRDPQVAVLGGHWAGPPDPEAWESEWAVLEEDLRGRVPQSELNSMRTLDAQAREHGDRVLFVPTFYAWGHK